MTQAVCVCKPAMNMSYVYIHGDFQVVLDSSISFKVLKRCSKIIIYLCIIGLHYLYLPQILT